MLYEWIRTRFFNKDKLNCMIWTTCELVQGFSKETSYNTWTDRSGKKLIPGALFHLDYWQGGTRPGHRPLSNGHGAKCHNNRYQVGNTKKIIIRDHQQCTLNAKLFSIWCQKMTFLEFLHDVVFWSYSNICWFDGGSLSGAQLASPLSMIMIITIIVSTHNYHFHYDYNMIIIFIIIIT